MCRHAAAPWNASHMAAAIGLVPVNMRQYVRHVIALPFDGGVEAYSQDDSVVVFGDAGLHGVLVEAAKGMGKWGMQDGNGYWGAYSLPCLRGHG
jgi:hypothetical protein